MVQLHERPQKRTVAFIAVFLLVPLSIITLWAVPQKGSSNNVVDNGILSFRVPFGDEVALRIITAERYGLDDDQDDEWSKVLPAGGHLVHIATDEMAAPEPYTLTLFHQLKCLDIIRAQYKSPPNMPISSRTSHCMNYLRQTALCRPNLRLESVDDEFGRSDRNFYDTVCHDWTALYGEAERNQAAYEGWKKK
ncbi:hypothetical protein DFH07DRAFT_823893 [Mycena maculata]|uniref:Uncharacterized protein n=1 Tax=Mycena maculata TaxID=230809 RepID=A0AAD7IZ59_9AGAR|nr:hypothetical protein DFH07DRAFT_823893 [Mycena maculata]